MPSVIALRALLGAAVGLGAFDLVWINAALAPRLSQAEPLPVAVATTTATSNAPTVSAHDERAPAPVNPVEPAAMPSAAPAPQAAPVPPARDSQEPPADSNAPEIMHVYFDTGSAKLRGPARDVLAQLAEAASPSTTFVIQGHADYRGDERLNRSLSRERALVVQQQLVELGIDGARIRVDYAGEGNETGELWRDRRVDIQITGGSR